MGGALWILALTLTIGTCAANNILEKLAYDPDLSQFYSMLKHNEFANVTMQYKQISLFAPTNEAFQKFGKSIDESQYYLVLYHMTTLAFTTDQLASKPSVTTELDGNPMIWITRRVGPYHDDIFVNNARILLNQSNIKGKNNGKEQVLHKIDEVLVPVTTPQTIQNQIYNPNALEFLTQFESLNINPFRVRNFRQRVQELQRDDVFSSDGSHTYFIPVDEGFTTLSPALIDNKTIDGHVIPRHVLFTAPTKRNTPYQSLTDGDNLKVIITFVQDEQGKSKTVYVKSETLMGDAKHSPGVVLAEIVKANIPVRNGVVHLIHKPLMVVDTTVRQFLEDKDDGPLSRFCEYIVEAGPVGKELLRTIERSHDVTLFAPSNAAWDDGNLKNVLRNPTKMKEILSMHVVINNRISVDDILANNRFQRAHTLDPRKDLFFNVVVSGSNRTLTVEGGGVNATVIQPNLAATNGIIHIIDRVLGVPYTTVYDKLYQDPTLNDTFWMGKYGNFNYQLNDTTKRFTYFVPRNEAWKEARVQMPSVIKKLFMRDFGYHAQQILQRHLIVSDTPYTMEKLLALTANPNGSYGYKKSIELPSQRGVLKITVERKEEHNFVILWQGLKIPVFRPNVECTNGVIHVLDAPLLQEGDVRISGASPLYYLPELLLLAALRYLL